jgi:hypothetical protein
MSLPTIQYDAMIEELHDQAMEGAEDVDAALEKRGKKKYHISTHYEQQKKVNNRMSRLRRIVPKDGPWASVDQNYHSSYM